MPFPVTSVVKALSVDEQLYAKPATKNKTDYDSHLVGNQGCEERISETLPSPKRALLHLTVLSQSSYASTSHIDWGVRKPPLMALMQVNLEIRYLC